jgi:hypothetical protein
MGVVRHESHSWTAGGEESPRPRLSGHPHAVACVLHPALPAVPGQSPTLPPGWIHEIKHDGFRTGLPSKSPALTALLLMSTATQAEIMCTQHRGCWETGGRIISGNGGGVTSHQYLTSYRNGKPQRVRVRPVYSNG